MAMTAKSWSVSGLAVELKVDRRTVAAALAGVEPADEDGRGKRYFMADAVHALYGGGAEGAVKLDLTQESAALKKTQREKIEVEIAVLKGELIPANHVSHIWGKFIGACRAKLVGLPSTAAVRVVGLTLREVELELRDLVHQALAELKDYDPGDYHTAASVLPLVESDPDEVELIIEGRD